MGTVAALRAVMRSGIVLCLVAFGMVGCGASTENDEGAPATSDLAEEASPLDQLTYSFKLQMRPDNTREGCNLLVAFHTRSGAPLAGYQSASISTRDAQRNGGLLVGEIKVPRYEQLTKVRVTTSCAGDEDRWDGPPPEKRYLGESNIDLRRVETTPGPLVDVPLSKASVVESAGVSLKFGVKSVERGAPVPDSNCEALGKTPSNRFFVRASTVYNFDPGQLEAGDDFVRTLVVDGDAVTRKTKLGLDNTREWFTYCRPKTVGRADELQVKVDLLEKDVFKDDRYDSGDVVTVKVGDEARIEHRNPKSGVTHETNVLVVR